MYFSIHVLQLEVDQAGEEGKYTEISWLDLVAKEAARQRQVIKDILYIPVYYPEKLKNLIRLSLDSQCCGSGMIYSGSRSSFEF